MVEINEEKSSVSFTVRVVPRSSKSGIVGEHHGAIKVKLKAPPVDGAANDELISLLAKELGVSRSEVEITSGQASRTKRVRIGNANTSRIRSILKAKS
jgi:uncharacterized protein